MIYRLSRIKGKNNKTIAQELNLSETTIEGPLIKYCEVYESNIFRFNSAYLGSFEVVYRLQD